MYCHTQAANEKLERHEQRLATQKATELTYVMSLSRLQTAVSHRPGVPVRMCAYVALRVRRGRMKEDSFLKLEMLAPAPLACESLMRAAARASPLLVEVQRNVPTLCDPISG